MSIKETHIDIPPSNIKIDSIEIGEGKQVPYPVKLFTPPMMRETGNIIYKGTLYYDNLDSNNVELLRNQASVKRLQNITLYDDEGCILEFFSGVIVLKEKSSFTSHRASGVAEIELYKVADGIFDSTDEPSYSRDICTTNDTILTIGNYKIGKSADSYLPSPTTLLVDRFDSQVTITLGYVDIFEPIKNKINLIAEKYGTDLAEIRTKNKVLIANGASALAKIDTEYNTFTRVVKLILTYDVDGDTDFLDCGIY